MNDIELLLLGTGTAFGTDGRHAAGAILERGDGSRILVDCGPTITWSLEREGVDPDSLDALLVTHLHGDHTVGWPFLALHLALRCGRTRPFTVVGPQGTARTLDLLLSLTYGELMSRRNFEIRSRELDRAGESGVPLPGLDGTVVDAVPLEHHASSLGLRVRGVGEPTIGISGDTRWCEGLERLADGCDALVLECTSVEPAAGSHVSLGELRAARARLRTPLVVLTHLVDDVARALDADPLDGVVAGRDGTRLRVAATTGTT